MTRQESIEEISKQIPDCEKCLLIVANCKKQGHYDGCMKQRETIKKAIEALSTDIVRCKDCKYTETDGYGVIYCQIWDRWEMPGEGFCFRGCLPEIMTPPQGDNK